MGSETHHNVRLSGRTYDAVKRLQAMLQHIDLCAVSDNPSEPVLCVPPTIDLVILQAVIAMHNSFKVARGTTI